MFGGQEKGPPIKSGAQISLLMKLLSTVFVGKFKWLLASDVIQQQFPLVVNQAKFADRLKSAICLAVAVKLTPLSEVIHRREIGILGLFGLFLDLTF